MVNKRVRNAVLGCNLKNDIMISVRFQSKPFNITVIQAYAPNTNTEEAEVERFCVAAACKLSLVEASGGYSFCSVRASPCGGFSCFGAWALGCMGSVVADGRLESTGSVSVTHGLCCSEAHRIFSDYG